MWIMPFESFKGKIVRQKGPANREVCKGELSNDKLQVVHGFLALL